MNDDWAYTKSVYNLYYHGFFKIEDWGIMTLVVHSFIGYLFCSIFGFSFTILRISTLIIAFFTSIVMFRLLKQFTNKDIFAFLGTLLLATNPLFINLSFSYMTDIPFLFFLIFSVYQFINFYNKKRRISYLYAILFLICAILIRQLGLIIAFAIIPANFICNKFKRKELVLSFIPLFISLIVLKLYSIIDSQVHFASQVYNHQGSGIQFTSEFFTFGYLYNSVWKRFCSIVVYIAIFVIPFTLSLFWSNMKIQKIKLRLFLFSGICVLPFLSKIFNLPDGNILSFDHLGILTLAGSGTILDNLAISRIISLIFSCFALISVFCFFYYFQQQIIFLLKNWRLFVFNNHAKSFPFTFSIAFILGYMLFIFYFFTYFDRYVLTILCLSIFILFLRSKLFDNRLFYTTTILFILLQLAFSIVTMRDLMEWSRGRQKAVSYLIDSQKVSKYSIYAGFEWNNWFETNFKTKKSITMTKPFDYWIVGRKQKNKKLLRAYPLNTSFLIQSDSIYIYKRY